MSVEFPIVEEALHAVLTSPVSLFANSGDPVRVQASVDLASHNAGVWVASRPQDDVGEYAITIDRRGGRTSINADSFPRLEHTMVDVTVWGKAGPGRARLKTILSIGYQIKLLIYGMSGTFAGVVVDCVTPESDPFQNEESPNDASDNWISGYTWAYVVAYQPELPINRFVCI